MTTYELARRIRMHALTMVTHARASHIGSALSIADIIAVLYESILQYDSTQPQWSKRDRFILSKGHACVAVYAALAEKGFFAIDELVTYGADHSRLMNHISHHVPGVEFSTGSLGHGLPFSVGKALAAHRKKQIWRTFVLLSDGELDEGSNWEAALFAAHHHLDNLIAIIDYNKLQSLSSVDSTLRLEPLEDKWRAFGWDIRAVDGHDHTAIFESLQSAPWSEGKPSLLLANTIKGKGVSFMENQVDWHYRSPSEEQLTLALNELVSPH